MSAPAGAPDKAGSSDKAKRAAGGAVTAMNCLGGWRALRQGELHHDVEATTYAPYGQGHRLGQRLPAVHLLPDLQRPLGFPLQRLQAVRDDVRLGLLGAGRRQRPRGVRHLVRVCPGPGSRSPSSTTTGTWVPTPLRSTTSTRSRAHRAGEPVLPLAVRRCVASRLLTGSDPTSWQDLHPHAGWRSPSCRMVTPRISSGHLEVPNRIG